MIEYHLIPGNRVRLEKQIGPLIDMKFPAYYGTHRLITVLTSACHLTLSRSRSVRFTFLLKLTKGVQEVLKLSKT